MAVITPTKMTISPGVPVMPINGPNVPVKKKAVPILMAPITVMRPSRLSHAVTQPVKRLPRIDPQ